MIKNTKKIKILSAVLALVLVLGCLTSCGQSVIRTARISQISENTAEYSQKSLHVSSASNLVYVAKSGLLELYFDSVTYGIAVKDTGSEKTWYSLPEASVQDPSCNAAVVSLTVSKGNQVYYLNSQDNSVAFSTASFKPLTNGVQITYDMALNAETAQKGYETLGSDEVYVSLTALFTLSDGSFYADINCSNLRVTSGFTVEKIEFLRYFGSCEKAGENDFMFVPDASGALIKTGVADDSFTEERVYEVYGSNIAAASSDSAAALYPCYGVKSGDNAFAAIILGGDALASIRATRQNASGTYNAVGVSFSVADTSYSEEDGRKYTGISYGGNINICYRFLSGKNAGYVGLASACREVLVRSSVLSTELLEESEHIPLVLNVQAAVSKRSAHSYRKLSTYEQTQELLELLKAKSVNSISLRYCGALDGADTQDFLGEAALINGLGSKKDLQSLKQYAKTQKFELYLDLSLLSYNRHSDGKPARSVSKGKISLASADDYSSLVTSKPKMYAASVTELSDGVLSFLSRDDNYSFDGYCINDAGSLLYSDYSGDVFTRMGAASMIKSQISVFSNNHRIMVDGGNFNMLFNADMVTGIPSQTHYASGAAYTEIPFAELLLHGIVNYTLEPINESGNSKEALLKSVEYGAVPSYQWICTATDNADFDAVYNYRDQLAVAADYYQIADTAIGDLANARMTSHYKVQEGVYCTEYNSSIIIYFNYTDSPVTVNSITVPAMSCLRAN